MTFRRLTRAVAVLLALGLAAPAHAQSISDASRRDLQCFVTLAFLAGSEGEDADPDLLSGIIGGMGYFLGRLEGRDPNRDWLAYVADQGERLGDLIDDDGMQRCGQEMAALGARMSNLGKLVED